MPDSFCVQGRAGINIINNQLSFGTIDNVMVFVWRVLWSTGVRVVEPCMHISDVSVHCKTAGVFDVIPFEIDPDKFSTCPVCADLIVFLEGSEQVLSIVAACVLDAEVVHNQREDHWACLMAPQTWGDVTLDVATGIEVFGEEVVGKFACLFEPVHALGELEIYPPVVYILFEVLFIDDLLRDVGELDAGVLGPVQWCVEIEIG